jgi:nitric oxide synthase oxygenase domain/subunit
MHLVPILSELQDRQRRITSEIEFLERLVEHLTAKDVDGVTKPVIEFSPRDPETINPNN